MLSYRGKDVQVVTPYLGVTHKIGIITMALNGANIANSKVMHKALFDASIIAQAFLAYTDVKEVFPEILQQGVVDIYDILNEEGTIGNFMAELADLGAQKIGINDLEALIEYGNETYNDAKENSRSIIAVMEALGELFADIDLDLDLNQIKDVVAKPSAN